MRPRDLVWKPAVGSDRPCSHRSRHQPIAPSADCNSQVRTCDDNFVISPPTLRFLWTITAFCAAVLLGFGAVMMVAGTFDDPPPSVQPIVLTNGAAATTDPATTDAATTDAATTDAATTDTTTDATTTGSAVEATTTPTGTTDPPRTAPVTAVSVPANSMSDGSSAPTPPRNTAEFVGQTPAPANRTVATAPPPAPIAQPVADDDDVDHHDDDDDDDDDDGGDVDDLDDDDVDVDDVDDEDDEVG